MGAVEVNGHTIEPGANLRGADLSEADLSGAKLFEANLYRANLTRTRFYRPLRADLRGAEANNETRWPEGFDPEAFGVFFD